VRLFCVCAVLCVGSGLATGGVLPTVYRITKLTARAQKRAVEPLMNHNIVLRDRCLLTEE
jgi:hypothetical protein